MRLQSRLVLAVLALSAGMTACSQDDECGDDIVVLAANSSITKVTVTAELVDSGGASKDCNGQAIFEPESMFFTRLMEIEDTEIGVRYWVDDYGSGTTLATKTCEIDPIAKTLFYVHADFVGTGIQCGCGTVGYDSSSCTPDP